VLCLHCPWAGASSDCKGWPGPFVKRLSCPRCLSDVASLASAAANFNRLLEARALERIKEVIETGGIEATDEDDRISSIH